MRVGSPLRAALLDAPRAWGGIKDGQPKKCAGWAKVGWARASWGFRAPGLTPVAMHDSPNPHEEDGAEDVEQTGDVDPVNGAELVLGVGGHRVRLERGDPGLSDRLRRAMGVSYHDNQCIQRVVRHWQVVGVPARAPM